jgi:Domain of unknown function (DUF4352)
MIRRIGLIVVMTAALALPLAAPASAATSVVASWKAVLGTSGYNGTATLVTNATGTGALRILAKRLVSRATYPVQVRLGSCSGTLLASYSTTSSSTATIARSFSLTTTKAAAVVQNGSRLYARIGSSTGARCSKLVALVPTGATSGMTVRVPAGKYSGGVEMFAVQAFEAWTPEPDSGWQPKPGNVMVTALVRIQAVTATHYNPYDFQVRDAAGLQYDFTIGRDQSLDYGDLTPGRFVSGWLTFEVPAAAAAGLQLVYAPTYGVTLLVRLTPLPYSEPTPTPTPTPAATPTPTPTPAATPTPVPVQMIELRSAVVAGKVAVSGRGINLQRLEITLTSQVAQPLQLVIDPVTVFHPGASGTQTMMTIAMQVVTLAGMESKTLTLNVACGAMHLDQPGSSDQFGLDTAPSSNALVNLLQGPDFASQTFRVKQFAIWTITDNPARNGYVELGSVGIFSGPSDAEIAAIKQLFVKAGLDPSAYLALA